jgi:hypothetical protein
MKHLRYFIENVNYHDINKIIDSYLGAALWTSEDSDEELGDKTIGDFSIKARKQAKNEIEWFIENSEDSINNLSEDTIGHNLWLSRNGHGSSFRDCDEIETEDADFLMELSSILGEISIFVNKNKVEFDMGSEKYKEFDLKQYKEYKIYKNDIRNYNV